MNDTTMGGRVKVELVESGAYMRFPCHVCGGSTEKVGIHAKVRSGPYQGLRVCEFCLEARDFDAKLLANAARLEGEAQELRGLVGRLDVPAYAEYLAATAKHEREVVEFYEREERERELRKQAGPSTGELSDAPF